VSRRVVTIESRYNGPPDSGNGGYACGIVASGISGCATARLFLPPPLDVPLTLDTDTECELRAGDSVVAKAWPSALELEVPEPVTLEEADAAAGRYRGFEEHIFSTCFVCGPNRDPGDGLRIFAGDVGARELVASPWTPHAALADEAGVVCPEFVWAALDCPGAFSFPQVENRACVLGELTLRRDRDVRAGAPHVVTAWYIGSEGRKHFAGTALFTAAGERCAAAKATWIETTPVVTAAV